MGEEEEEEEAEKQKLKEKPFSEPICYVLNL